MGDVRSEQPLTVISASGKDVRVFRWFPQFQLPTLPPPVK